MSSHYTKGFKGRRISPYVLSLLLGASSLSEGLVNEVMAETAQKPAEDQATKAAREQVAVAIGYIINFNNATMKGGAYNREGYSNPMYGPSVPGAVPFKIHAGNGSKEEQARDFLANLYRTDQLIFKNTGKHLINVNLAQFQDPRASIPTFKVTDALETLRAELGGDKIEKALGPKELEVLKGRMMGVLGRSPSDPFPTDARMPIAEVQRIKVVLRPKEEVKPEGPAVKTPTFAPPVAVNPPEEKGPKPTEKKGPPVVAPPIYTVPPARVTPPVQATSQTVAEADLATAQARFERAKDHNNGVGLDQAVNNLSLPLFRLDRVDDEADQLFGRLRASNRDVDRQAAITLSNYYFLAPAHRTEFLIRIKAATNSPNAAKELEAARRFYDLKQTEYVQINGSAHEALAAARTSALRLPPSDSTNKFGRDQLVQAIDQFDGQVKNKRADSFVSFRAMHDTYERALSFARAAETIGAVYTVGSRLRPAIPRLVFDSAIHSLVDINWGGWEEEPAKKGKTKGSKNKAPVTPRQVLDPADYVYRSGRFVSQAAPYFPSVADIGRLQNLRLILGHDLFSAQPLRPDMRPTVGNTFKYPSSFASSDKSFAYSVGQAAYMVAEAEAWLKQAKRSVSPEDRQRNADINKAEEIIKIARRELERKVGPDGLINDRYAGNAAHMALSAIRLLYPSYESFELLLSSNIDNRLFTLDRDRFAGLVSAVSLRRDSVLNPFTSLLYRTEVDRREGQQNVFTVPVAPGLRSETSPNPREQNALDEVTAFTLTERDRATRLRLSGAELSAELADLNTLERDPNAAPRVLLSILDRRIRSLRAHLNESVTLPGGKQVKRYELTSNLPQGYSVTPDTQKYLWYIQNAQSALADAESLMREFETIRTSGGDVSAFLRGRVSPISAIRMIEGAGSDGDVLKDASSKLNFKFTPAPKPTPVQTEVKIASHVKVDRSGNARIASIDSLTIDGKPLTQFGAEFRSANNNNSFSFTTYFIFIANDTEVRDSSGKTVAIIRKDTDGNTYAFGAGDKKLFKLDSDGTIVPMPTPDGFGDFAALRSFGQPTTMKLDGNETLDDLVASTTAKPGDVITVKVITAKRSL